MENLLLPSKIEFTESDNPRVGIVTISPCYYGYGTTLGNAIRRVLLSSLPGAAVEAFKINGVQHEFTTIEGVKEDVVEIMLNIKQLIVNVYSDEPVTLNLSKKGPGAVTGADFEKNSSVEIVNKDQIICNLTSNKPFELEITVGRGRGFKTSEQKDRAGYDLGTIIIDSIYTPIKDVGYSVEYTRVGDVTNYEKLILTIETNGTVSPRDAVYQAVQILMDHFSIVLDGAKEGLSERPSAPAVEENETEGYTIEEEGEEKEKKVKKTAKTKKKTK
jgi:DNA-directed RNA polymerase subunit alpha